MSCETKWLSVWLGWLFASFRFWRREAWGFKSLYPHHGISQVQEMCVLRGVTRVAVVICFKRPYLRLYARNADRR